MKHELDLTDNIPVGTGITKFLLTVDIEGDSPTDSYIYIDDLHRIYSDGSGAQYLCMGRWAPSFANETWVLAYAKARIHGFELGVKQAKELLRATQSLGTRK